MNRDRQKPEQNPSRPPSEEWQTHPMTPADPPSSPLRSLTHVAESSRTKWIGKRLEIRDAVTSTMHIAGAWARGGEESDAEPMPHGSIVVAREQTGGRGRHGRVWSSPRDLGLYLSVLLRVPPSSPPIAPLAPAAGLAVAEALSPIVAAPVGLKWPNDVRIGRKKVAGLLAHADSRRGRIDSVVLGVGINIFQDADDFPPELRGVATSLILEGGSVGGPDVVLAALLPRLENRIDTVFAGDFQSLVPGWNAACDHLGRPVEILHGGDSIKGRAIGIDAQGRLRLSDRDGKERAVGAGELIE
ncbi:MAG: biotin--[acetyl-CoA-carboxylase] ligase [Gemmatimonadetes bacterium]|nr:biotin--[acetyl-CoA-carboxylase] ligase [Gemmatimonadota bacterium]